MNDFDAQLQKATQRRTQIASRFERLRGRLEEAEANKASIEEEIRAKKIQPEQLEETISKLEDRFATEMNNLETAMQNAESALEPYENGER